MSLINEALKRTEADKGNRSRSGDSLQGMTPSYEDPPAGRARRSLGQDVRSVLLRVGILAVAVSCVLLAVEPGADLLLSRISPAGAAETHGAPTGDGSEVDEAIVRMAAASRRAAREAEIALRKTMDEIPYYQPPSRPPALPAPAAVDTPKDDPRPPAPPEAGADPASQPAPKPAAQPEGDPSASKPQQPQPRFRLTGIVAGEDGPVAIVNGFFVREGHTVSGAKVVRVGSHTVVLDVDGALITIKM